MNDVEMLYDSQNNLRLFELLLNCDGVGEVDDALSASFEFNCDRLLAFNCSCC